MSKPKSMLFMSLAQRNLVKHLESNRGRLYRMAYAWTHDADTAEDVVQEATIKALKSVDSLREIKALDGWLFRILHNCFYDHCRKQRDSVDIDDIVLEDSETPEHVSGQDEMLRSVRQAIGELPVKYREVVTLVDIESFAYAEVAEILDVPIGTVMSRLNRARGKLREMLQNPNAGDNAADLQVVR